MLQTFMVTVDIPPGVSEEKMGDFVQRQITQEWKPEDEGITEILNKKEVEVIMPAKQLSEVLEFIQDSNGKIFSIIFIKRTTGEERKMAARTGVKSKLVENPTKPGLDFKKHELIPVFDMSKQEYRSIPIEGIRKIKIDGIWFHVNDNL